MKESNRAARSEIALKRQVAAVRKIAGEEQAAELERLSGPARYPEVNALLQQELVADILEDLIGTADPQGEGAGDSPDLSFLSEEQAEALHDAGYTTPDEMRAATDEELEAVQHIGKATVKKIREALDREE